MSSSPPALSPLPPPRPSSNIGTAVCALGIGIGVGGGVVLLLLGISVFLYIRHRRVRLPGSTSPPIGDFPCGGENPSGISTLPQPFFTNSRSSSVLPCSRNTFRFEELAAATDNFSAANLLGQGGFGYVHKGTLSGGRKVAIKQLKPESGQGEREFRAEVETISHVYHKHLVPLCGHCISGEKRLLVYEYVPNRTLEFHLHGHGKVSNMNWATRMKIAIGAARGLAYLHEECKVYGCPYMCWWYVLGSTASAGSPKIIHRDIKSANILLDENFEPKVADFGLARFYSDSDSHVSTRVMGTFGYLAPEYALTGKLTDKSDVFSFGVVLLELITGRKPIDKSQRYLDDNIIDWARPLLARSLEKKNFDSIADPKLQQDYDSDEMTRMVTCASVCVRHLARRRPRMSQVLLALEGKTPIDELKAEIPPTWAPESYGLQLTLEHDALYNTKEYKDDLIKFRSMALQGLKVISSDCSGPSSDDRPFGSSSELLTAATVKPPSFPENLHSTI